MQHPSIKYYVTRPEESPSSYIPTLGHIASNFDAYRTIEIAEIENRPESWCFTDTDAAGALGRLIDGPIKSGDIEKAESALRAILLHDVVEIIVPCAKAIHDTGFVSYQRFDNGQRNEASFTGLNVAPCKDLLMAFELINISNGEITASSNLNSKLVGYSIEDQEAIYNNLIKSCAEVANAYPIDVGASSYFAKQEFQHTLRRGSASFITELYQRIHKPWINVAQSEPALFVDVRLPPLVAIVLSRAPSRENIPSVLTELREELTSVRVDLNRLNRKLDSTATQADINALVRSVNESFDAIVPEALLTNAERRKRRITSVFNFFTPMKQLYSIAVDPLSADPEKFIELFNLTHSVVLKNSRIVSRSVTAAKFSELLRVESVRGMVTTHFTKKEIKLLEKGALNNSGE